MSLSFAGFINGLAQAVLSAFQMGWWIILPAFLLVVFNDVWLLYIRLKYIKKINWVLLRVRTPRDLAKTPKAMEQVFAAIAGSYSFGIRFYDKYIKGRVENWLSFELVGDPSGVYFLIRVNQDFRNLIESAIYAEYPEAEIEEVADYIDELPAVLPNRKFTLFGIDFVLGREDVYPIRTYPAFEEKEPEEKIDTVSIITEVMSRLKENERIWIQLLVRPTAPAWKEKAVTVVDDIMKRKKPKPVGFWGHIFYFFLDLIQAPWRLPQGPPQPEKTQPTSFAALSKGEQEIIRAVEEKTSKIGFESLIRFVYIDEREKFTRANIAAVSGAFQQFNTLNLNRLMPDLRTITLIRGKLRAIFKERRTYYKQRRFFDRYRLRFFPRKFAIFNVEELATLYHFPTQAVAAPGVQPVEFKKGTPPSNLPL